MATNKTTTSIRPRRDSTESTASLWEKIYEPFTQTQRDAPFANDERSDSLEQNPVSDENEDGNIDSDASLPVPASSSAPNTKELSKPWEKPMTQDQLTIIVNDGNDSDELKRSLKNDLSRQGLKWTKNEEELRPWYFGLTAIHLQFNKPQIIDLQMLLFSSAIPFWMKLKTEKQKNKPKNIIPKKASYYSLSSDYDISLRYGALTDLNHFYYSPQHSWKDGEDLSNKEHLIWSFFLDNERNGGHIEWVIQNSQMRRKKQLLVTNIDHFIIVDPYPEGFDIYICQKCNMNEFEANAKDNNAHKPDSEQNNSNRRRSTSRNFEKQQSHPQSNSRPRPAQLLREPDRKSRQERRILYDYYHRIGRRTGCYFPTVQFSLRINPLPSTNNNSRNIQNQMKQTLSLLIEFFLAHRITVCYGKINSDIGPHPYLFFQPNLPRFPTLIMKYSWQMLSSVGYRLQLQINQENFLDNLHQLSTETHNPDELFYRVCVYLSRIFPLKPFLNINEELQHAINESKRKRDHAAYGLVRKIDIGEDNEAYVPSVTLTPTTIRIKPLKLCRTNRVLRATEQFGTALEHFILVDIRDENHRHLQSFHFRDLRSLLLKYVKDGFTLMDDNREYKYLHHSQSQLRGRQFWFYHHDKQQQYLSFPEAYRWMGDFDEEKNPAKHAARIALCFSTTRATVQVHRDNVLDDQDDIKIVVDENTLLFTDGCGTMSTELRDDIKQCLGLRNDFSAVQFRYDGAKGVVSVHPDMPRNIDLYIRHSMKKFYTNHDIFEVCKLSAPRSLYLNQQAILLLDFRKIPGTSFLILQQQYHLSLIRALLRNSDAEKLILQKTPSWFLPRDIHHAKIDFIHEPFFRQLLITACLQSTRELLQRTRIRIPPNAGRNMIGIVDEYNVLKPGEVYIQYTLLVDRESDDDNNNNKRNEKTKVLDNRRVVITKNPCHHPGDIRTFTAVNYPRLKHLKDVVVFSQQGDRPAPHAISGSDLDGDEYLVLWHEDLVPYHTENAPPYDYDSHTPAQTFDKLVTRKDINNIVLNIAEEDYIGRLSRLHLAFADKYGVDDDRKRDGDGLSTVKLAGAISQEVDSVKTGYHPLTDTKIKELNNALGNTRPDYMENLNFEPSESDHILGKLYRASKRTLPGWNRLLRYHRHLRHLQVRTRGDELEKEEEDKEENTNNDEETNISLDPSLVAGKNQQDPTYEDCTAFADQLAFVYRQEVFEILNLYGISHESDLWCRNSVNSLTGEFEDTAITELEQLVVRTKNRFFLHHVSDCIGKCDDNTPLSKLCEPCRQRQQSIAVACYKVCYDSAQTSEQAPILSLPWIFAAPLLQSRINQEPLSSSGLLSTAMGKALNDLVRSKRQLRLKDGPLQFKTLGRSLVDEANVDMTVCAFIEILEECVGSKNYPRWPLILSRFIQRTPSFALVSKQAEPSNEWELILQPHKIDKSDFYAGLLVSMIWTETEDTLMHGYFQDILDICFEEGRRTSDIAVLDISENIILLLQKMAIKETII